MFYFTIKFNDKSKKCKRLTSELNFLFYSVSYVFFLRFENMGKNIYCRASKFNVKVFNIFYKSGDLYMNKMGIFLICVFRNYI